MSKLNIEIPDELDQKLRAKIRSMNNREVKKGDIKDTVIAALKLWVKIENN